MIDQKDQRDKYVVTLMCAVFLLVKHEGGELHVSSKAIQQRITKIAKAKNITDAGQVFDAVSKVVLLAEELSLHEVATRYKRPAHLTDVVALKDAIGGSVSRDHAPINEEFIIELMLEYSPNNFGIEHGEIAELNRRIAERTGVPEFEVREMVRKIRHHALDRYEEREKTDDRLMPRLEVVQTADPHGKVDLPDEAAVPDGSPVKLVAQG